MNEIKHVVKPNAMTIKCASQITTIKTNPPLVSALIQPSELEVHRQVPLTDAKIAPSKKMHYKICLKYLTL